MTTQAGNEEKRPSLILDSFHFRDLVMEAVAWTSTSLFHPSDVGITPATSVRRTGVHITFARSSRPNPFYRVYHCTFEIDDKNHEMLLTYLHVVVEESTASETMLPAIADRRPTITRDPWGKQYWVNYQDVRLPVPFYGGLLLGASPFEAEEQLGLHAAERAGSPYLLPHEFQEVHEFVFSNGRLTKHVDHSAMVIEMRDILSEHAKAQDQRMEDRFGEVRRRMEERVSKVYKMRRPRVEELHVVTDPDYTKWGMFRDFEAVRSHVVGPYSVSFEEMERKRVEKEESYRRILEHGIEEKRREEVKERLARRLFEQIKQDGWTCISCGCQGIADKDFRLSLGKSSCVICRKCGWVQKDTEQE